MPANVRVVRRRIRSVQSTKKITRAMELISASRIVKAQQRVAAAAPYASELTEALSAVVSRTSVDHPLTAPARKAKRAAVVVVTADRGLAGGYSVNAIKEAQALTALLHEQGTEVSTYMVGRKGIGFFRFRNRELRDQWSGFSDAPTYGDAKQIAQVVLADYLRHHPAFNNRSIVETQRLESDDVRLLLLQTPDEKFGVDEIHLVFTEYISMATQRPVARRLVPLEVADVDEAPPDGPLPLYEFEPDAEQVLDALLPRYIESRIYNALLQSAASEHAARRRAMKAATDNAEEMIRSLTRQANAARQAEITQEISEIVGGANALAQSIQEGS